MRTQPVEFLEPVEFDLRDARNFYDSWQTCGAEKFQARFRETVAWVEWNPELFPRRFKHFRRAIIRRTYFGIFYVIEPGITVVVAVLDLRREAKSISRLLNFRAGTR